MTISNKGRVLVTGGAGYIGTHVVEKLLKAGFQVRIFDKFVFGKKPLADLLKNKKLEVVEGDIGELSKLLVACKEVDYIVHLAGLVGDPACAVNRDLTLRNNIISTQVMKELAKSFKVKKFIFASSCSVYGSSEKTVDEKSKLNPVSLYAETKIDSEKETLRDKSVDLHPTILRFATVFGDSRRPRFDLVANFFTAQAYTDGLITVTGSNQWRPFVHVSDIASAIVKVIQSPAKKVDRQIFNVGDDKLNLTIGDLAKLVQEVVKVDKNGKKVEISVNDKVDDKRNYFVSFKKIKTILKFKSAFDLKMGVKEIHKSFLKGKYKGGYKDKIYSNVEMTKLLASQLL